MRQRKTPTMTPLPRTPENARRLLLELKKKYIVNKGSKEAEQAEAEQVPTPS